MKSLIAQHRAYSLANITRQSKAKPPEGCDSCDQLQTNRQWGTFSVKKDECACFDSSRYGFLVIGDGLTIEGNDYNGKAIAPVQNAWGAATGYYKITATTDTTVYYAITDISPEKEDGYDDRYIAVFKKSWEGTIFTSIEIK